MDFILRSANKLDLHILLRVNDYLGSQEFECGEAEAKRDARTSLLRERLDRERLDRERLEPTKRHSMLRRLFRACKRLMPARREG